MRVLLSAYACEPGKGAEPGVGWHWAIEVARLGHEVWVLTRANNRSAIESALAGMPAMPNLRFLYYDLPRWSRGWKKGGRGVRLYYSLWQWGAYRLARKVHMREKFELVQHVTFGVVRHPSFMGNLGIPFVFGPVSGGERTPWRLQIGSGARGWFLDFLRDVANFTVRFDPLMRRTFCQANSIVVTSQHTLALIPRRYRHKGKICLAIGSDGPIREDPSSRVARPDAPARGLRIMYVGRMLYWKGMHLGLPAFARLLQRHPDARLTMIGDGPDEAHWRKIAADNGITDCTEWVARVKLSELFDLYRQHDVLLYPTLHDSGGMQIPEALALGLPVICLDLGGTEIVNDSCGRAVKTAGRSRAEVIEAMASALGELAGDQELRKELSEGAFRRAEEMCWRNLLRQANPDLFEADA